MKKNVPSFYSKRKLEYFILFLSLAIIFIHSLNFYQQKNGYFLDETLSFRLSNSEVISFDDVKNAIADNTVGQMLNQVQTKIFVSNQSKDYDETIANYTVLPGEKFNYLDVYVMQAGDVHPPLYYFVINTLCSIFPSANLNTIGFIINIISLLLVSCLVYLIGLCIFEDQLCAIAAMLYYGLSFDFINNATYYRMYALLTFWTILLVYINIKWMKAGFDKDNRYLIALCVVEYIAMMTQYFALFFCIPLFIIDVIFILSRKKEIKKFLIYEAVTAVIYLISWPYAINHLLQSDRGSDVAENLGKLKIINNMLQYKETVSKSLFFNSNRYVWGFLFLVCIAVLIKIVKKIYKHEIGSWISTNHFSVLIYIFATALIYFGLAANSVPWFVDRYLMPVIPLFSIVIVYIFLQIITLVIRKRNIAGLILIIFSVLVCMIWHRKLAPYYLYNDGNRMSFKENYSELDAVIIDKSDEVVNSEIELNFTHPRIYEYDNNNIEALKYILSHDSTYVTYIRNTDDCDDVIIKLSEMGYNLTKMEFETEFYNIYQMN